MRQKIDNKSSDLPVSISDVDYAYVQYLCDKTFRGSDELFRTLIRSFQAEGVLPFNEWVKGFQSDSGSDTITETAFAVVNTPVQAQNGNGATISHNNRDTAVATPTIQPSLAEVPTEVAPPVISTAATTPAPVSKPTEVAEMPTPTIAPAESTSRKLRVPEQGDRPNRRAKTTSTAAAKVSTAAAAEREEKAEEETTRRRGRPPKTGDTGAEASAPPPRKGRSGGGSTKARELAAKAKSASTGTKSKADKEAKGKTDGKTRTRKRTTAGATDTTPEAATAST